MRRAKPENRPVQPDLRYHSVNLANMVQHVMTRGKRSLAVGLVYDALDLVKERTEKDPVEVFETALKNVAPMMEVRPRRVGGATYQVPMEVRHERQTSPAIRWLVEYARERAGKGITDQLAGELLDAASEKGGAFKKREDVHKMAESNRAFAHYRW